MGLPALFLRAGIDQRAFLPALVAHCQHAAQRQPCALSAATRPISQHAVDLQQIGLVKDGQLWTEVDLAGEYATSKPSSVIFPPI